MYGSINRETRSAGGTAAVGGGAAVNGGASARYREKIQ